ncbi:hypothetical protein BC938DRAFT_471681 [Jimgerdemannia flammicorona]|uniref:Uncharacterized protein n=1 Tax=Jimgerdemannia flammicorona TaxID=994334 RepID=A0A433QUG7_9FUNG|nr:hypothetical protein BC938DRAFT_471681 [Jimgerdemannia flammicorona]
MFDEGRNIDVRLLSAMMRDMNADAYGKDSVRDLDICDHVSSGDEQATYQDGRPPVWGVLTGKRENSVELVNTFFGFECLTSSPYAANLSPDVQTSYILQVPRPIGPLVHLIGSVVGDAYPALTSLLSAS